MHGREGDCTYARKVHWAKKALARGIIIIDSKKGINNLNPRLNNQNFHIYLMPENDGDYLISKMEGISSFVAQLNLGGQAGAKAEAELWISSLNKSKSSATKNHTKCSIGGRRRWLPFPPWPKRLTGNLDSPMPAAAEEQFAVVSLFLPVPAVGTSALPNNVH